MWAMIGNLECSIFSRNISNVLISYPLLLILSVHAIGLQYFAVLVSTLESGLAE